MECKYKLLIVLVGKIQIRIPNWLTNGNLKSYLLIVLVLIPVQYMVVEQLT